MAPSQSVRPSVARSVGSSRYGWRPGHGQQPTAVVDDVDVGQCAGGAGQLRSDIVRAGPVWVAVPCPSPARLSLPQSPSACGRTGWCSAHGRRRVRAGAPWRPRRAGRRSARSGRTADWGRCAGRRRAGPRATRRTARGRATSTSVRCAAKTPVRWLWCATSTGAGRGGADGVTVIVCLSLVLGGDIHSVRRAGTKHRPDDGDSADRLS